MQEDACVRMREFCDSLHRPFNVIFDPKTSSVRVDANVELEDYKVTLQSGESM